MEGSSSEFPFFDFVQYQPKSVLSSLLDPDLDGSSHSPRMLDMMLDEELAEIDMESYCREDIHNLLLSNRRSCALVNSSIYRPESLFSPVPDVHLSQDSLDMSCYPSDIILTCKANKQNYTLAFDFICSEASFCAGIDNEAFDQRKRDLLEDLERRKASLKMSASVDLTTWSKLKKTYNSSNLHRYVDESDTQRPPSRKIQCWDEKRTMGCSIASSTTDCLQNTLLSLLRKTKSLSSLTHEPGIPPAGRRSFEAASPASRFKLNVSQVDHNMDQDSSSSYGESNKLRSLLPNCAIPVHPRPPEEAEATVTQMPQGRDRVDRKDGGCDCATNSITTTTTSNNNPVVQPSFNLVKLFIKQKSNSTDTCMDVSSGCWPSDCSSQSFEVLQQQGVNANIQNRNYFKRRLEGSASNMERHVEENDVDSLDALVNNNNHVVNNNGNKLNQMNDRKDVGEDDREKCANKKHTVLENNNNLINNLINNNHLGDSSEENNLTQIYNNIRNSTPLQQQAPKNTNLRRIHQMDTVTRSMQTSIPKLISSTTTHRSGCADAAAVSQHHHVKIVPSSFLKQLHKNERRGDGGIAPVYVIYPNYTLPNLDFVAKHEVILSPIDYKESFVGAIKSGAIAKGRMRRTNNLGAVEQVGVTKGSVGRPKSFNDILGGKQRSRFDYKNICDWRSLIVLLPIEYRRILRSIPDIEKELEGLQEDVDDGFGEGGESMTSSQSQKKMFCQTTPVMRRKLAPSLSCDCTAYVMHTSSSSSSSNQPASSGYRGSSTILTDSELGVAVFENSEQSEDSTASGLPPTHCGRTPKGILRRNFYRNRGLKTQQQQGKRNSMFEGVGGNDEQQQMIEKRRSLQEFPTQQYFDNIQLAAGEYGSTRLSPLLNYKQQGSGSGLNRFRKQLNSEFEALEMELLEARNIPRQMTVERPEAEADAASYDRLKLRNDVSHALRNQPKRVSFSESNDSSDADSYGTVLAGVDSTVSGGRNQRALRPPAAAHGIDFTTPPNSPNISVMAQQKKRSKGCAGQTEQERIQSNRFKRLQIQWELLSKDSDSLMKEMLDEQPSKMETKSGGSTPTAAGPQRVSRIPRPISYPAPRGGTFMRRAPAAVTTATPATPTKNKFGSKKVNTTNSRFVPKVR